MPDLKEEYDYNREPELDEYTRKAHKNRSRYFFAMISFLAALLLLSVYLNNYLNFLSGWLVLLGIFVFGAIGVFFLQPGSLLKNQPINSSMDYQGSKVEEDMIEDTEEESFEETEDASEGEVSPFEHLVEEALASIPAEFQEKMENVLVRVQYEPGEEVLERVGMKRGYTLLGLYEGVPLTTYGHDRVAHPEIITIYQRTIEAYCHGDSDRIRDQVRHTVLHEVAHHFGIDHEEMPIWVR